MKAPIACLAGFFIGMFVTDLVIPHKIKSLTEKVERLEIKNIKLENTIYNANWRKCI